MNIGVFLEIKDNQILPVGFELIGEIIKMMGDKAYKLQAVAVVSKQDDFLEGNLGEIKGYLDTLYRYEYEDQYLTTDHYKEALCDYVEKEKPEILLLGATPLGRSFGPRVAAYFKTGMTADCTEIRYEEEYGLVQTRPAFGEEILAEIVTPKNSPQMATIRPGVMEPPTKRGEKNPKICHYEKDLLSRNLKIIERQEKKQEVKLEKAKLVVVAGNAIREKEDLLLVKQLAAALGGEYGVTRPLVEGGLAPHSRQVGVSGTILSATVVLLLGASGSNQTLAGIRKAKKIVAINKDPNAKIFEKVDIGILDDWKEFTIDLLNKKGDE